MLVREHYDWQRSYEAAILETDQSLLPERIAAAQSAIDRRIEEMRSRDGSLHSATNGHAAEEQALADALSGIRILIKEVS